MFSNNVNVKIITYIISFADLKLCLIWNGDENRYRPEQVIKNVLPDPDSVCFQS